MTFREILIFNEKKSFTLMLYYEVVYLKVRSKNKWEKFTRNQAFCRPEFVCNLVQAWQISPPVANL